MWGWFRKKALPFVLRSLLPVLVDWINGKIEKGQKVTVKDVNKFIEENR